jgi:hypothetical protein
MLSSFIKKIKKLFKHPNLFLRDYLNKKYPYINNEQDCKDSDEGIIINNDLSLYDIHIVNSQKDVDVVFTWIDNGDKIWQEQYEYYSKRISNKTLGLFAKDMARFENHDELKYALKSVKYYLPWVRNIFLVTDNQIPNYLLDENVIVIKHNNIIDNKYLPTFNSHVIEAHLHKIPDLSENFIYFNDDVFAARKLPQSHFFQENDIASMFISCKSLTKMQKKGIITPTLTAALRGNNLLQKVYKVNIDNPIVHTYVPLKKSVFNLAYEMFGNEIQSFLPNRFRMNNDLNLATFLVPWLMYLNGKSVFRREICYYFNIRSPNAPMQYKKLLQKKQLHQEPHSFCTNDFNSNIKFANYEIELKQFLKQYFATKSKHTI